MVGAIPIKDKRFCFPEAQAIITNPEKRSTFSVQFGRICGRAQMPQHSFHDLRHTVATRLLDKGVAPQTFALMLGDTVQTVMNTYAHATSRGLGAAMAAVDD